MAIVAARNGSEVCILTRRHEVAEGINANHRNPSHLTDTTLPESISATTDAPTALANASIIIHCIPVQGSETFLGETQDLLSSIPRGCRIVCCSKGIETGNLEFMHQLLPRIMSKQLGLSLRRLGIEIAVLSGPTFAEQLALSQPSGVVIAARTHSLARECAWYFASSQMRVYPSTDIVGVEACGALKNVYALLAGGVEALDMHENTISLLTTRAGKEIARLAVAMGGKEHTMASVAGMGDLWLTTLGGSSR
jgi:glycerol-3-phosphate dehydrogenase